MAYPQNRVLGGNPFTRSGGYQFAPPRYFNTTANRIHGAGPSNIGYFNVTANQNHGAGSSNAGNGNGNGAPQNAPQAGLMLPPERPARRPHVPIPHHGYQYYEELKEAYQPVPFAPADIDVADTVQQPHPVEPHQQLLPPFQELLDAIEGPNRPPPATAMSQEEELGLELMVITNEDYPIQQEGDPGPMSPSSHLCAACGPNINMPLNLPKPAWAEVWRVTATSTKRNGQKVRFHSLYVQTSDGVRPSNSIIPPDGVYFFVSDGHPVSYHEHKGPSPFRDEAVVKEAIGVLDLNRFQGFVDICRNLRPPRPSSPHPYRPLRPRNRVVSNNRNDDDAYEIEDGYTTMHWVSDVIAVGVDAGMMSIMPECQVPFELCLGVDEERADEEERMQKQFQKSVQQSLERQLLMLQQRRR